ncbi:cyanophycinase [Archangium gephyra]|uniref:Cyanophycinase n=1 Tax=Archangium gephyra TaxID=48 RepID=A0AAC8Q325_9BACT|nr:cyanophycinase [Archangium gephyra]AKJ00138.1 Cyanophycinase [Archangium gephyra]REG33162.1 cyanophycinase [Archangium gephyra]
MARKKGRTNKNGNGKGSRERVAQRRTQLARPSDESKGPPARALSPSDERRPIAGRLIIIGGHEDRENDRLILRQVTNCAKRGRVVVCTVASDVPQELWKTYERAFRELGCSDVVHLDIERRADLLIDPPLHLLEGADAFFFTGGGQLKITTRFAGTRLCAAVEEFYRKGGTVAGTSAGAAAMSDTMLVTGPSRESHKIGESLQMAPGLGFIRDVIVDQHFAERGRIGRLLGAVAQNPRFIGLGIDEDTAVIVEREERFTVIGAGAVYVADAEDATYTNVAEEETSRALSLFNVRLHVLSQGDSYDLRTRQPSHQFAKKVEERLERAEHHKKAPSHAEAAGAQVH